MIKYHQQATSIGNIIKHRRFEMTVFSVKLPDVMLDISLLELILFKGFSLVGIDLFKCQTASGARLPSKTTSFTLAILIKFAKVQQKLTNSASLW